MNRIVLAVAVTFAPAAMAQTNGVPGGRLVVAHRTEPRTLNPILAVDESSRTLSSLLHGTLLRFNGASRKSEGYLADSWRVVDAGRRLTVKLRPSLRFSDGQPLTAADVLFSVQLLMDDRVAAPQRDLLVQKGQKAQVRKVDDRTVELIFATAPALGERVLEGITVLPRHKLEAAYTQGSFADTWKMGTAPAEVVGSGPFLYSDYQPGQKVVLKKNPHYWRSDAAKQRMPYLDEVELAFHVNEDAQVARLLSGGADVLAGLTSGGFDLVQKQGERRGLKIWDGGPGLDYTFLLFNLAPKTSGDANPVRDWFQQREFRTAISWSIDRSGLARLVYGNRAAPLAGYVSPGRNPWVNEALAVPVPTAAKARDLLRQAGFHWNESGRMLDRNGRLVQFSLVVSSSNSAYLQSATFIEADLKKIGMEVRVVPLEFRSLVDRVANRRDYEAALMALRSGDVDPAADMNVLLSSGRTHLWNPAQAKPATEWEAEIDRLFEEQMVTADSKARKARYDRIQAILVEQSPWVSLVAPHILVGGRQGLENVRPSIVGHPVLWNAEELYWRSGKQVTK